MNKALNFLNNRWLVGIVVLFVLVLPIVRRATGR